MTAAESLDNTHVKDARIESFWREFCAETGIAPDMPYQAWHFGDSPQLAHELVELVIHGPKRATAGLLWFNEIHPQAAPVPNGYSVVTEFDGAPRAVIRTTWLDMRPFSDVDRLFAWDEGEGDRTLADWKDGHWKFFSRECAALGRAPSEDMPVVLERFELLWPLRSMPTIQLSDYALNLPGIARVYATVHAHNAPSMRVLEKNGFTREGLMAASALKNGKPIDRVLYAKVRR